MTIYITGDIHGDAYEVRARIDNIFMPSANDYIIVCGDACLEYGNVIMESAKKEMKKFPGKWIIMRGNHDNRYWRDHILHHGWSMTQDGQFLFQHKYPNIFYVQDEGQIATIDGYTFLFIPGAYSVDKYYRLANDFPYEEEEQLTKTELKYLKTLAQNNDIDFIIGHTYPISIQSSLAGLFMSGVDQNEIDKQMEYGIDEILNSNKTWKHYFFGHMHDDIDISDKHSLLYHDVVQLDNYIKD